jgi:hypothetical protein
LRAPQRLPTGTHAGEHSATFFRHCRLGHEGTQAVGSRPTPLNPALGAHRLYGVYEMHVT